MELLTVAQKSSLKGEEQRVRANKELESIRKILAHCYKL